MPFPYDATLKDILHFRAADFAPLIKMPTDAPSEPLSVDLSTVSAATDLAFGFGRPYKRVVDINFQTGQDPHLADRLLLYNALHHHHRHVPVRSIVILLRPAADHAHLTGQLSYQQEQCRVEFTYEVIRLWEQPVETCLSGGLELLPLATLCRLAADVPLPDAMREVVHQIEGRLGKEASEAQAARLMTATYVLAGIRVQEPTLSEIFRGVKIMLDSSAFTVFEEKGRKEGEKVGLKKGRVEECQRLLLRQGEARFGPPDAETNAALQTISDLDRLERLADAVLTAKSWQEFLATP